MSLSNACICVVYITVHTYLVTDDIACYRSDFIYDLFEHMSLSTDQGQNTGFSRAQKKGAKKKATVSSQFKVRKYVSGVDSRASVGFFTFTDDNIGSMQSLFCAMHQAQHGEGTVIV